MFNNIIYFIIVLFIYNVGFVKERSDSFQYDVLSMTLLYIAFLLFSRILFRRILYFLKTEEHFQLLRRYHRAVFYSSVLAILIFSLDVYLFGLKFWINHIPGADLMSVISGVLGISVFLFYLCTIWHISYDAYSILFQAPITRKEYIIGNIRFNIPILFPWVFLSFIYDILSLIKAPFVQEIISGILGQSIFFGTFLLILMIFMPAMIRTWWGCKPFEDSYKVNELKEFLKQHHFKYREILRWPLFEGRMMTAGVMGIIPRYRFILITDSLMEQLSIDELKAVLAHEMGHIRYGHLIFYLIFFMGYVVLSAGIFDIFFYYVLTRPQILKISETEGGFPKELFFVWGSLPIILSMILYFRYVMGFFMRNFERQADLYSSKVMGTPYYTISSLEKIAFISGKIRDMPSWHHFSIKERVECLLKTIKNTKLLKKHNQFVFLSFFIYLMGVFISGYFLYFTTFKERVISRFVEDALRNQILANPDDVRLYMNLAMLYHQTGDERKSIKMYEKALEIAPSNHVALNNLAWILATSEDRNLRDYGRALKLAKKAVSLKKTPEYLDTLAEAYFVNGKRNMAIKTIKEAISIAKENKSYYEQQLKKFTQKLGSNLFY